MKFYVGSAEAGSYQFNKQGLINVAKVIGWSCASAAIASLIAIIPEVDVPTQWIWLVPIINTLLVAIKKFVESEK